jgi:hypothetical protein
VFLGSASAGSATCRAGPVRFQQALEAHTKPLANCGLMLAFGLRWQGGSGGCFRCHVTYTHRGRDANCEGSSSLGPRRTACTAAP